MPETSLATSPERPLTGVVLAGGMSTRLGRDKTTMRLHGGLEMALHMAELLERLTPVVWISCRPGKPRFTKKYKLLFDEVEGMGPFGGVITALRHAKGPVLVAPCDLPFMDQRTLESLVERWRRREPETLMTTFLQRATGYIEALVSIYEHEALARFEEALNQGNRKIYQVVPPERRSHVPYEPHEARPFFNINSPEDLESARQILGTELS